MLFCCIATTITSSKDQKKLRLCDTAKGVTCQNLEEVRHTFLNTALAWPLSSNEVCPWPVPGPYSLARRWW